MGVDTIQETIYAGLRANIPSSVLDAQIKREPVPPITTWEELALLFDIQSGKNLELWYLDRTELRTDSESFRTADGEFFSRQQWDIIGLYQAESGDWEDSYFMLSDRLDKITGWFEENLHLEDTFQEIMTLNTWSYTIRWHEFRGERYMFSGHIETELIIIQS